MSGALPRKPSRRRRRASWRAAEFASLDFETTGLDYERDVIVSFGVVPVRGGRVIVREALQRLVAPSVPVSPASMRVHHILPQDLAGAATLAEAREELRRALDGRFVLTWFADVEIAFLGRIFQVPQRPWSMRVVDVRRMVLELEGLDDETRQTLSGTAARYGIPVASPHEALDDALVAAQLFLIVASKLEELGYRRVGDLLRLTPPAGRRAGPST